MEQSVWHGAIQTPRFPRSTLLRIHLLRRHQHLRPYDGDNLIEETNSSGTAVARYSQGLNIDQPLAELRASATSYYEADGLGSVSSLTSSAGALANLYTYDSFGNVTNSTGTLNNPFEYTGREFDSEANLYYYRARYYDPRAGRFLNGDPAMFSAGINLGAGSVESSLESNASCAAFVIWSASSASTTWNPPGVSGAYQQCRTVSSMLCALHLWLGILCNSAANSAASASAIVLLPTPDGPTNSHAPDAGRLQNVASTFLGRSKPMKSAMRTGRYFSTSD